MPRDENHASVLAITRRGISFYALRSGVTFWMRRCSQALVDRQKRAEPQEICFLWSKRQSSVRYCVTQSCDFRARLRNAGRIFSLASIPDTAGAYSAAAKGPLSVPSGCILLSPCSRRVLSSNAGHIPIISTVQPLNWHQHVVVYSHAAAKAVPFGGRAFFNGVSRSARRFRNDFSR